MDSNILRKSVIFRLILTAFILGIGLISLGRTLIANQFGNGLVR